MSSKVVTLKSPNAAALIDQANAIKAMGGDVIYPVYIMEEKQSVGKFDTVTSDEPEITVFCIDVSVSVKEPE